MALKWRSMLPQRSAVLRVAVLGSVISLAPWTAAIACGPASAGYYSAEQAASGKTVFETHCSACHLADLSGSAGPALAGRKFADWLEFTKITGAQLFAFIASQMPYDAPGSLTMSDYEDAFAYILQFNHYPAGSTRLEGSTIACVQLLPYPTQR